MNEEKIYFVPVRLVGDTEIIEITLPTAPFCIKPEPEAIAFVKSNKTMAFVKLVPISWNWTFCKILLLYNKSNIENCYFPKAYSEDEQKNILQEFQKAIAGCSAK